MPRRNHAQPHQHYEPTNLSHNSIKRAFSTKRAAQEAARDLERYDLELNLSIYQSPTDGKWYLSSRLRTSK